MVQRAGKTTLDRAIQNTKDAVEINASTDASNATVKLSQSVSGPAGRFHSYSITASAPLNQSGGSTDLVSLDGLTDSFTLGVKYNWFRLGLLNPEASEETRNKKNDICDKLNAAYRQQTGKPDEPDCGTDNVKKFLPAKFTEFKGLFFDPNGSLFSGGFELKGGYKKFGFIEAATLNKMSDSETPWSIEGFMGGVPNHWDTMITGGFRYQQGFKNASSGTLCPPSSSGPVACKTGAIGKPVSDDAELLYVELRRRMGPVGVSLKATYDFKNDLSGVDLPISFVKDSEGNLTGGVRVGWNKTQHWQAGVFVSKAFSFFGR